MSDEHVRIARNEAERIMSDIEPGISEREAEQQYPTQYWEGTKVVRILDRDTDDLQQAYICGRTAEPCKEQVRAAAEALSAHMHEWDIDHGFDREVDNGFHCSCGVGGYTYEGLWAHLARVCLNAAREAVM